jgi:hypothetical protein
MGGLIEVFGVEVNAMDAILYVWFALVILSVAYVSWDNFIRGNPEEAVMKWGWLLITLYMGPSHWRSMSWTIKNATREGDIQDDVSPAELATYCVHALTAARSLPSRTAVRRLVEVTLAGLRPAN